MLAAELTDGVAPPVDISDVPPPPAPSASRIAIIGRGEVGLTLGRRLVQGGWSVQFGSRNPDEVSFLLFFFLFFDFLNPLCPQARSKSKPDAILDSSPIVTIAEAAS
jgi:hypothetical protein